MVRLWLCGRIGLSVARFPLPTGPSRSWRHFPENRFCALPPLNRVGAGARCCPRPFCGPWLLRQAGAQGQLYCLAGRRSKVEPRLTTTSVNPRPHTMAAPIGKSALAVTNRLPMLAAVAIPHPTRKRAVNERAR